jgi:CheY-like chemotaxis protein
MSKEKPSLLLVDGSANYLVRMGMLLRKLDFRVRSSMTAEEALWTLYAHPHSLVMTDTALQTMSGIDMLRNMKQDPRLQATPVIIHTSEQDQAIERTCFSEGCAAFFRKPAEPNALYRAIQAAIKSAPRKNIRIDTILSVEIGDWTGTGGNVKEERLTTLSENGAYIKTHNLAPVHAVLPLAITIKNRKIRTKAAVMYTSVKLEGRRQVPGMGLKFVDISKEDRSFVREFIQEQLVTGMFSRHAAV